MAKPDLKHCPFCGCEDISLFHYDPYDGYQGNCGTYVIRCAQCGCLMRRKTINEAESAWNTRFNSVADATNIHKNS